MKVKKSIFWIILSSVLLLVLLIAFAIVSGNVKYKKYMRLSENELVAKLISEKFILDTKYSEDELKQHTPKEMVELINDKYSEYLTVSELEKNVQDLNNRYVGLGFEAIKKVGEDLEILSVMPHSPSYYANLKSGDKIIQIDGALTKEMDRETSLSLIRGEEDSSVTLTILRDDGPLFDVTVVRKAIENQIVDYKMIDDSIGYIYISEFPLDAAELFIEYLKLLKDKGMEKLILDLRGNSGGEIQEIVPIASSLLNKSIKHLFSIKRKNGSIEKYKRDSEELFTGPLVILCNESTASASELLISILKDYHRCILIGEQTHGKQISQEFFYMGTGNILKLSTGFFISPNKSIFNKKGITPDIVVSEEIIDEKDLQLEKALNFLNETTF